MTVQTTPLEVRLTDPHAFRVATAGGTPVMEVDTLTLALKLSGRLMFGKVEVGPQLAFFNGSIIETIDIDIESDGTTITLSLQQEGGGDLTLVFSDGMYAFDCTPAATVALTAGTDTVPRLNYIYIPASTKVMTANTTGFPTAEHVEVATVIVQSVGAVQADGALKVHEWTNHVEDMSSMGHLTDLNHWVRAQHATWLSGVAQTLTIIPQGGAPDNVNFATTAGVVLQLHEHTMPVFNTASGTAVYVINDFTTKYIQVTDLNALLTDSANAPMSGRYFNLVLWASVSEKHRDCKLFVNLPSGSYNKLSDAVDDVLGYTNFSIPVAYKGAAFLISRLTLRHQAAAGGTWTAVQETDLRGQIPNVIAGGGAQAITTEFADSTFRLFDETDPTRLLALQLSGITTGSTRTLTVQDADGVIALVADITTHAALDTGVHGAGASTLATAADIATHAGLPDVHHVAFVQADADLLYDVLGGLAAHLGIDSHHNRDHGAGTHTAAVLAAGFNENLGAYYLDIDDIAVPANPGATIRRLFVDQATGELSVRTNAGVTVSLEQAAHPQAHGPAEHTEGGNWKALFLNDVGDETEFALGAIGTFYRCAGAAIAPTMSAIQDLDVPAQHTGTLHHVSFLQADADLLYDVLGGLAAHAGLANPHHNELHAAAEHIAATLPAGFNEDFGAFYFDIGEIAVPANPGVNVRRVFLDNATGEISVRTSAGATVSLEAGGAGVAAHNILDGGVAHLDAATDSVTQGSIIVGNATPAWDELIANASATRKFLRSVSGGIPAWDTLVDGDIPSPHAGSAHHAQAHTLASHSSEAHSELSGVSSDQHHAETHALASHTSLRTTFWDYGEFLEWVAGGHAGSLIETSTGAGVAWTDTTAAEASHPGTWWAGTGSVSNGHPRLSSHPDSIRFSNGRIKLGMVIKIGASLSSGSQRYEVYTSIMNSIATNTSTNGVYLRYRDNYNGGKWQCGVINGGGHSNADSGVMVAGSTWYLLEIEVNAAGNSVEFFINGSSVATIASGPAANATAEIRTGILKSIGTTARFAAWDMYYLEGELAATR